MTLELRDVTAGYGAHTVLRSVDLVVPDGAVVALVGPNGAGKSTLLRVAAGLLRPTAGAVVLDGVDITGQRPERIADHGLCLLPEGRGVFTTLTVAENARLQGLGALPPLLRGRERQLGGQLSGGERQVLGLARPAASGAGVVLIDEVSMGLAPQMVDEVYAQIQSLAAAGTALLIVEQYVRRALDLADYVWVLRKGRVAFAGEPRQLADEHLLASYLGSV